MTSATACISIGIGRYSRPDWPGQLNYAAHDATWFAQFAKSRGIPPTHICLLIDENATRQRILWSIRNWTREIGIRARSVLIYFAGHGLLAKEGNAGERPLLLPYDVTIEDPSSGAIEIRDILTAVKSTGTRSVFLFIDACSQDITSLFDGPSLSSLLLDVAEARDGCFFAAIAGHRAPAYEGGSRAGGLFTATLFDSIESVEAEDRTTIGNLTTKLESECSDKVNLRVALIGSTNVWLFPPTKAPVERQIDQDGEITFKRAGLLQALAKSLRDRPRNAVFLWGPSPSGKTVALRQLLNDVPAAVYVSCQDSDSNVSFFSNA